MFGAVMSSVGHDTESFQRTDPRLDKSNDGPSGFARCTQYPTTGGREFVSDDSCGAVTIKEQNVVYAVSEADEIMNLNTEEAMKRYICTFTPEEMLHFVGNMFADENCPNGCIVDAIASVLAARQKIFAAAEAAAERAARKKKLHTAAAAEEEEEARAKASAFSGGERQQSSATGGGADEQAAIGSGSDEKPAQRAARVRAKEQAAVRARYGDHLSPAYMRWLAQEALRTAVLEAIGFSLRALRACGGPGVDNDLDKCFEEALAAIPNKKEPCGSGPARALRTMGRIRQMRSDQTDALKRAENFIRDLFIICIRTVTEDPKDQLEFDRRVQEAAGKVPLSKAERGCVYQAYHKDAFNNVEMRIPAS